MNRIGILVTLVLVLAAIGFASIVRVRGPGGATGEKAARRAPAPPSGVLLVPVQGVPRAALVDSWADPRDGGLRTHHALDIPAPLGTPVLAASAGRIEKLFESKLGGHTLYERSADGQTIYYYAHLDRYAPSLVEGQAVPAGAPIAAVGATGDANPSAPHLHFEVHRVAPGDRWWQGSEVDPYPLLAGSRTRMTATATTRG